MNNVLKQLLNAHQARIEATLNHWLPKPNIVPANLHKAMRYAALDGGKRVRPFLVYSAGQALGVELQQLDGPAAAVELIHVYSLIHDDLPAMDDDDLRRGKPSCHRAFGEATAILAGDALQSLAFQVLASEAGNGVSESTRLRMIKTLAPAAWQVGRPSTWPRPDTS